MALVLIAPVHVCAAGFWFLYLIVYGELPLEWSSYIYHMFIDNLAPLPAFWLLLLVTPVACLLPGFFIRQATK